MESKQQRDLILKSYFSKIFDGDKGRKTINSQSLFGCP